MNLCIIHLKFKYQFYAILFIGEIQAAKHALCVCACGKEREKEVELSTVKLV